MLGSLYQVKLPYATYGIIVNDIDLVVEAAPIARWMTGKHLLAVTRWVVAVKGGTIELVEPLDSNTEPSVASGLLRNVVAPGKVPGKII